MNRATECKRIREQLLDLVSPASPVPGVREHLNACAECAAQLQVLRQTMSVLDGWETPEPSPYFDTRLQAKLREEKLSPQRRGVFARLGLRWQPAMVAALALVMVVGGIVYRSNQQVTEASVTGAVTDLQALDKNGDVYANFDMLFDDNQDQDVTLE